MIQRSYSQSRSNKIKILSKPNTIFLGDFNAKHTLWGSTKINSRGRLLEENLEDLNLEIYKMEKNHISFSTGRKEVLQILLLNKYKNFEVTNIQSLNNIGSDHLPVRIEFKNLKNDERKTIKMYYRIDHNQVNAILETRNTNKVFTKSEIDNKINKVHNML